MSERLVNYLITYNSEDGYTFYTNTFNKCTIELPVFGARVADAQDPTDPAAEDGRCVRFLTSGNYHIESFVVSSEDILEGVSVELQFSAHTIDWDNSYVIAGLEEINYTYTFIPDNNIINIISSEQIENDVEIQIAYWEAAEFIENETYHIKITEETSENDVIQEEDIVCLLKEEVLYIGDYDAFMDIDEESAEEYIYEIELIKNNYAYIAFDKAIIDAEDGSYKYKVGFDEGEVEPSYLTEYIQYGKETILSDVINDHGITRTVERKVNYVGNLYIYDITLENTREPFLITTEEATQFLPCLETSVISGETYYFLNEETDTYDIVEVPDGNPAEQEYYRYVQVVDSDNILYVSSVGTYSVTLDNYNLIEVPQLVGSALLSMGRVDETTGKMEDNYGIGINSSDLILSLPKKAISLFETEVVNDQVKYRYRGILGTLPQANQVGLTNSQVYSNYMQETQGIFTNNMYLGDDQQYLAFYTKNGQKRLDVTGGIHALSLTIAGSTEDYNGIAAINATGYSIEIIEDKTRATVTDTYLYPILYHNGNIETISDYTQFVWYIGNSTVGIRGLPADGGIGATYGESYRVTYDLDDSEVGEAPLVQTRIVETQYITRIDQYGITIHPENLSSNNYIRLDGTGLDVINNNVSVAKYGSNIRIGAIDTTHVIISDGLDPLYTTAGTYIVNKVNNVDTVLAKFTADEAIIGGITGGNTLIDSSGFMARDGLTELMTFRKEELLMSLEGIPIFAVRATASQETQKVVGSGGERIWQAIRKEVLSGAISLADNIDFTAGDFEVTLTLDDVDYAYTFSTYGTQSDAEFTLTLSQGRLVYNTISAIPIGWHHFKRKYSYYTSSRTPVMGFGAESEASGSYAIALGKRAKAMASNSVALQSGVASGGNSVAFQSGIASGSRSVSFSGESSGSDSRALAYLSLSSGSGSMALNTGGIASGEQAICLGYGGLKLTPEGTQPLGLSEASGDYSLTANYGTKAGYDNQTAIGKYNDNQSDTAFEIGNGTASANRSNAFAVTWDGDVECSGNIIANDINITTPTPITVTYSNCTAGSHNKCYQLGKLVVLSFNINITTATSSYDYIQGLPIPLAGNWACSSGVTTNNAGARFSISSDGTLRSDGTPPTGWHNGNVIYICE